MNNGAFGENFPYSNFHDLNMDWIIKIAKDFLDQYTNIQNTITNGLTALDEKETEGLTALEEKKNALEALLDEWYNTHSEDIAEQLTQAIADFASAADLKAAQTIASIPSDYTNLFNEVVSDSNAIKILSNGNIDIGTLIDDTYLRPTNGTEATYSGYKATSFIDIDQIKTLAFFISGSDGYAENAFYDANRAFISSFRTPNGYSNIAVPTNAKYVRFSNTDAAMDAIKVYAITGSAFQLSSINTSRNGIVLASANSVEIPANYNSTIVLLSNISLTAGTYYVSCDQKTSLNTVTRNTLFYKKLNEDRVFDTQEVVNKFAGHRIWEFTIYEAGTYEIGMWVVDNSDLLILSNIALTTKPEITTIPNYYTVSIHDTITEINRELTEKNSDSFIFITDIHYPNNRMFSPLIAKKIADSANIRKIIINGDYINQETTKYEALNRICETASKYTFPGIDTYRVVGNHEYNNPSASNTPEALAKELSSDELRTAILDSNVNNIVYDENTLSYYFDNPRKQIRYLVGAVNRASSIVQDSIKFIADNLINLPNGWYAVIIIHTALTYNNNAPQFVPSAAQLVSLVDAVRNRESVTIEGNTYDFNAHFITMVGVFCGDYHLDMVLRTPGNVPFIATTCDAMQEATGGLARTIGTTSEIAFDVVCIDKTENAIYLKRIGAGTSRSIGIL